ncbi:MAG TPA: L,D-transpeptidase [Longimicrobiaceae bacterium]
MMAAGLAGALVLLGAGCGPLPSGTVEPPLRLELNVPAYRLELCAAGRTLRSYRVAVGTRKYPTPLGEFRISEVVWNPWWRPPDSPWARGRKVTPPGPENPLGRVRLSFRELYHLHGTPDEASLGSAASHGCVRLSNSEVVDLARRVVRGTSPAVREEELDRLASDPWRTSTVRLASPVPLRIVYEVAEVRDGRLEIHPDVYRRVGSRLGDEAIRVLREHGVADAEVDRARLARLLEEARRGTVSAALEELVRPGASARSVLLRREPGRGDPVPPAVPAPCV